MKNMWRLWTEIKTISSDRDVVFYGRSEDWIPKAIKKVKPICIVDNNQKYHGTEYRNIPVSSPQNGLYSLQKRPFVIITAGIYDGIVNELINNGFVIGDDFSCCPDYRDFKLLDEMRNHNKTILVACSDYNEASRARYSKSGGGLYTYDLHSGNIEKKLTGSFRQLAWRNGQLYALDFVNCEVLSLTKSLEIDNKYTLDAPNYCGLAYNEKHDKFIIINAGKDTISIHNGNDLTLENRVHYSNQNDFEALSEHHLNDVTTDGDNIYVTYFSHSGHWKKGVFDGGVSKLDIMNLSSAPEVLVRNLWKPHSPELIDGELCYLDSMRGRFYRNSQEYSCELQSFARGLTSDGRFFFIGSSEDMYMSERFGYSDNIMLNAGFFMFDLEKKASRFYPMLGCMNIHDLTVL